MNEPGTPIAGDGDNRDGLYRKFVVTSNDGRFHYGEVYARNIDAACNKIAQINGLVPSMLTATPAKCSNPQR